MSATRPDRPRPPSLCHCVYRDRHSSGTGLSHSGKVLNVIAYIIWQAKPVALPTLWCGTTAVYYAERHYPYCYILVPGSIWTHRSLYMHVRCTWRNLYHQRCHLCLTLDDLENGHENKNSGSHNRVAQLTCFLYLLLSLHPMKKCIHLRWVHWERRTCYVSNVLSNS